MMETSLSYSFLIQDNLKHNHILQESPITAGGVTLVYTSMHIPYSQNFCRKKIFAFFAPALLMGEIIPRIHVLFRVNYYLEPMVIFTTWAKI